jgi:CheY-like chemotaxis protein
MENITVTLQGLAALAWPVIVIIIIFSFRQSIKELLESFKSRKFTIKIAGNELTMEEATEQQSTLIDDLLKQVVALQKNVETLIAAQPTTIQTKAESIPKEMKQSVINSILWVDDNPKGNAFFIDGLLKQGINVVTALSTDEGLTKFKSRKFDRVVSDLVRLENGVRNSSAGLDLVRQIRALDSNVPIIISTSIEPSTATREMVRKAGATDITATPTGLLGLLQL